MVTAVGPAFDRDGRRAVVVDALEPGDKRDAAGLGAEEASFDIAALLHGTDDCADHVTYGVIAREQPFRQDIDVEAAGGGQGNSGSCAVWG